MLQINRKVFSLVRCSTDLAIKWAKVVCKKLRLPIDSFEKVYECVWVCVYVCVGVYFSSYYTCWALKEVCSFLPCRSFQIKRRFYQKLARQHQPSTVPLPLPTPHFCCLPRHSMLSMCVYVCVYADYFLVYLVTKSRFLFKLKSSLTPALNIIIKRGKKPSQLASYLHTHTHTPTAEIHTHTHTVTCSRHQSPLKFNPQI